MQITYKGSLQRTMIIFFLMISFASCLIAGEFLFDINSEAMRSELIHNFTRLSNGEIQADLAFHPIEILRDKAILMVGLFLIVVLILLTMFIRNITEPLQHMIEASKLIAVGDLSQTVSIRAKNELAEMGGIINQLTSNLQEMLLLAKDMCTTVDQFTEEVSAALNSRGADQEKATDLQNKVHVLNSKTKLMNDIILHCKFYGIRR